jgi:hypothetical protein
MIFERIKTPGIAHESQAAMRTDESTKIKCRFSSPPRAKDSNDEKSELGAAGRGRS